MFTIASPTFKSAVTEWMLHLHFFLLVLSVLNFLLGNHTTFVFLRLAFFPLSTVVETCWRAVSVGSLSLLCNLVSGWWAFGLFPALLLPTCVDVSPAHVGCDARSGWPAFSLPASCQIVLRVPCQLASHWCREVTPGCSAFLPVCCSWFCLFSSVLPFWWLCNSICGFTLNFSY